MRLQITQLINLLLQATRTNSEEKENCNTALQTKLIILRTSLAIQWLRLHASSAGCAGLIPGQELRSLMPCSQKNPNQLSPKSILRCVENKQKT